MHEDALATAGRSDEPETLIVLPAGYLPLWRIARLY
jgi:hypothetical protein